MSSNVETYRRAFPEFPWPMLSYGLPHAEACRKHMEEYGCRKAFILASGSLCRNTTALEELQYALPGMVVGVRKGMTSHTLISECLEVLEEVRRLGADCMVTLGGGSLSDAAKVIAFADANDVKTREDLLALPHLMAPDRPSKPQKMPIILIPSTLSGGEYTKVAGVTDGDTGIKWQFAGQLHQPDLIILSGELALTTPMDMWIASGVRAIDHCVEILCATVKTEPWPQIEAAGISGLRNLVPGLLSTRANPKDAAARLVSHLGVNCALLPLQHWHQLGASHGIGHILGPMGVVHGMTSAVLMPSVAKYNAPVNEKDQALVRQTLWDIPASRTLFESKGLSEGAADLGDLLDCIIRELKMPRSLTEVGITGQENLEKLAANSMHDNCVRDNPRKIVSKEQVLDILKTCI